MDWIMRAKANCFSQGETSFRIHFFQVSPFDYFLSSSFETMLSFFVDCWKFFNPVSELNLRFSRRLKPLMCEVVFNNWDHLSHNMNVKLVVPAVEHCRRETKCKMKCSPLNDIRNVVQQIQSISAFFRRSSDSQSVCSWHRYHNLAYRKTLINKHFWFLAVFICNHFLYKVDESNRNIFVAL